jgi:hypothetical protein
MYDEKLMVLRPLIPNGRLLTPKLPGRQRAQGMLHLVLVEGSGHE